MKKTIAIIGTQGLPSKYGGFETLADQLCRGLSKDFDIIVYCSSKIYKERIDSYNGARLKYLPFNANGLQSILYDSISLLMSLKNDKILLLGGSSGLILPFLRNFKNKFVINLGGLDWKRSKWSMPAKWFIKLLEMLAVRNCGTIISDNEGIRDYIRKEYNLKSHLIAYGGDQAFRVDMQEKDILKYPFLISDYALSVARIQPDNNIDLILAAFEKNINTILVFVGNWDNSDYGKKLKAKYIKTKGIFLLDAIYNQLELNLIRSNCKVYIHGHSAGGTNPALVEAMHLGRPILAFRSGFNEYTTKNKAFYFKNSTDLRLLLDSLSDNELMKCGNEMKNISQLEYTWEIITKQYLNILK